MALTLIQKMRRIRQRFAKRHRVSSLHGQLPIIKKLFDKHGFEIELTCGACPEQYDVTRNGKPSGYLRLRHGCFRVDYPDCGDETILMECPNGDGEFYAEERFNYLAKALKAIKEKSGSLND